MAAVVRPADGNYGAVSGSSLFDQKYSLIDNPVTHALTDWASPVANMLRDQLPNTASLVDAVDPTSSSAAGSIGALVESAGNMVRNANESSGGFASILDAVNSALNSFTSGLTSSADAANKVAQLNTTSAQNFADSQMKLSAALQRELRQTAYQDTVHSLREAGLNPMLAYMNGAVSASAPSASVSAAQTFQEHQNVADNIISVIKLISDVFGSVTSAVKGMTK